MFSFASLVKAFILVLTALVTLLPKLITSQIPTKPNFHVGYCNGTSYGNYTRNSFYQQNLNLVFSDLVSQASSGAHFYNSSAGVGSSNAAVYGQYYCRGDISSQLCHDCVKAASLVGSDGGGCFPIKMALLFYEECTFWYDAESHVGTWAYTWTPGSTHSNGNVSDPTKFGEVLSGVMGKLIQKAAYGGDPLKFATGDGKVTQSETVYGLVQCSPDIVGLDCEGCLKAGQRFMLPYVGSEWVIVFYPNCQMRYGLNVFYTTNSTSPPQLSPSAGPPSPPGKDSKKIVIPLAIAAGSILFLCCVSFGIWCCFYTRKRNNERSSQVQQHKTRDLARDESQIGNIECFGFKTIEEATTKFSFANKLGEGGFGSVYKGMLSNGNVVAIKRLSRNSYQGIREFKTEVAVVAKLQHRNLVRLIGYCLDNEERVLVYEFLPNLSLDKFLFDNTKSLKLDWRTRYKIIEGIARGLRYLHIDSLLTIVHRDLKSSNILLDEEMNPKIADFGMAKLVKIDETTGNTSRIGGTYGYMAPEYAMTGRFSIKSDIYSFGVIILEVLSGKSISQFYDSINGEGLLHHCWRVWTERTIEELVDPTLQHNYSKCEAERCLQIGMLCVQDDATTRPTIRLIIGMLENQSLELPYPSAPSSFFRSPRTSIISSNNQDASHSQPSQVGLHDSSSSIQFNDIHPR